MRELKSNRYPARARMPQEAFNLNPPGSPHRASKHRCQHAFPFRSARLALYDAFSWAVWGRRWGRAAAIGLALPTGARTRSSN